MLACGHREKSSASGNAIIAAPEDGRTPGFGQHGFPGRVEDLPVRTGDGGGSETFCNWRGDGYALLHQSKTIKISA